MARKRQARAEHFVAEHPTESAAMLAAARIMANGGPVTEVGTFTRHSPTAHTAHATYVFTAEDVDAARAILALFVR